MGSGGLGNLVARLYFIAQVDLLVFKQAWKRELQTCFLIVFLFFLISFVFVTIATTIQASNTIHLPHNLALFMLHQNDVLRGWKLQHFKNKTKTSSLHQHSNLPYVKKKSIYPYLDLPNSSMLCSTMSFILNLSAQMSQPRQEAKFKCQYVFFQWPNLANEGAKLVFTIMRG